MNKIKESIKEKPKNYYHLVNFRYYFDKMNGPIRLGLFTMMSLAIYHKGQQ